VGCNQGAPWVSNDAKWDSLRATLRQLKAVQP